MATLAWLGTDAFTVPERAPKWLPEAYQYDKPPKPVLTAAPVYPLDLLNQNVKGSATVAFLIDPEGRTRQVIVKKATHPAFGAATVAMISAWEFEPARKNGRPSWAVLSRKQAFSRGGRDSPVNRSTGRLLRALSQEPGSIFNTTGELDRVPKPRYQPAPVVPESMLERAEPASAEIEFIIDRTGRAQLPRIVSATREDFGWAAATAVARWQFTPPTKHGKPVDVKARVPLKYVPPPEGVTEPAARPTP